MRILAGHIGGVNEAKDLISTNGLLKNVDVHAATVDSYQGGEADVVVYVTIESGHVRRSKDTEFSGCPRRGPVGLTRGEFVTISFGDSAYHCQCAAPFWGNVYRHCPTKDYVWTSKKFDRALSEGAGPVSWIGNSWGP